MFCTTKFREITGNFFPHGVLRTSPGLPAPLLFFFIAYYHYYTISIAFEHHHAPFPVTL